jgi:hypothetical protein
MAEENTPPPAPPAPPAPPPSDFDWAANGFAGDDLGYVQNKGFKNPGDMHKAYRNLEGMLGDPTSLIKLPKDRTPEAMRKDVWSKLGASDKVEDYQKAIPLPEGDKGEFAKVAAGWFHAHGVPVETAKALATEFNKYGGDLAKSMNDATAAAHRDELVALQKEKGVTWEDTLKAVDGAAQAFEMSADELNGLKAAMGPRKAIEFMARIATKVGVEGQQVQSDDPSKPNFKMTPAAAQQKIAALNQDPSWRQRFLGGDSQARAESEALHKLAYPEQS